MKTIIYQVLTRLWGGGKFSSFDDASLDYFYSLGVSHIWLTGVIRHSRGKDFVKGDPGSPYAICDYYDVNPYLADNEDVRMDEFESLLRRAHSHGLKVLIDFVPNHLGRDFKSFPSTAGIPAHPYGDYDWTDTFKIDYSAPGTWEKMRDVVLYWASKGVDGFRCDMVELVPAEFFRWLITSVKEQFPGIIFIAEAYEKNNYRRYCDEVGFDFLYDKSGLYDVLRSAVRGATVRAVTWNWQFLGDLQPRMLNFLENHDEERFASWPALYISLLFNDSAFMLYSGGEIGEDAASEANHRTSIFEWRHYPSFARLQSYVHGGSGLTAEEEGTLERWRELLRLAGENVFSCGKTFDLCYCNGAAGGFDADRHFAFLRHLDGDTRLVVCNFSDAPADIRINVPEHAQEYFGHALAAAREGVSVKVPENDAIVLKIS